MCGEEETQGFQSNILFVEIFAIIKRFGFYTFIRGLTR